MRKGFREGSRLHVSKRPKVGVNAGCMGGCVHFKDPSVRLRAKKNQRDSG